ncbi:hypothetical protein ASG25_20590 [Rhizobium sp. Leaf384]|uniref:hypothetical protein n=1 Tax=Rhizobium sp. Leaf384 TaxID=1736358 RepID=UPI000714256E|nr:hypothetical protein [Rhizobium sp. Leaf384]KQS75161.1 hypothetical protein ASG25_20590 [Rhizobium sp. Leaf384]
MESAHDLSLGAICSLQPTNQNLAAFADSIQNIRRLTISADGETLIYWSNEFGGRFVDARLRGRSPFSADRRGRNRAKPMSHPVGAVTRHSRVAASSFRSRKPKLLVMLNHHLYQASPEVDQALLSMACRSVYLR